ncbi:MAG: hypothetical protein KGM98_07845 [Bacteroidota bacterium]|nr:hypothetical protein [Bacteroidota bacterium]
MTFRFEAASIRKLMEENPDYFLFHVGYKIVHSSENPNMEIAQLTTDVEAFNNGAGANGSSLGTAGGCPVPPCKP